MIMAESIFYPACVTEPLLKQISLDVYAIHRKDRVRKVPVRGLLLRFLLNCLYKIPLLGYPVKIFTSVLTFPSILKNFQMFESRTSAQHHLVSHALS